MPVNSFIIIRCHSVQYESKANTRYTVTFIDGAGVTYHFVYSVQNGVIKMLSRETRERSASLFLTTTRPNAYVHLRIGEQKEKIREEIHVTTM